MQITEGETKNYSEDFHANELVVIDTSDPATNEVVAIPETLLLHEKEVRHERLPFALRVKNYWLNADLLRNESPGALRTTATRGNFTNAYVQPKAEVTDGDNRDFPAAEVEVSAAEGTFGTWLVGAGLKPQTFSHGGRNYEIALRFTRYYKPFSLTLLEATHEKYAGTEIPKNYASRVRVQNPENNEDRETRIYMNNPLRYGGLTFFQHQMFADEAVRMKIAREQGGSPPPATSTFQVVQNPGWLAPYLGCAIVAAGLVVQFMIHLVGFALKRRTA
jgi:hypothetical protein